LLDHVGGKREQRLHIVHDNPERQLQAFRQVSWNRQQACRIGAGAAPAFSVPRSLYGKWIFVAFLYTFW
jgi:hypothetical protein